MIVLEPVQQSVTLGINSRRRKRWPNDRAISMMDHGTMATSCHTVLVRTFICCTDSIITMTTRCHTLFVRICICCTDSIITMTTQCHTVSVKILCTGSTRFLARRVLVNVCPDALLGIINNTIYVVMNKFEFLRIYNQYSWYW
jgi:hypothetical protein